MKRKLVNEDLIKIKKLLSQLDINTKKVTFDLKENVVEASGEPFSGSGGLIAEEVNQQSEEIIIAEILDRSEVPEQTGMRYLQRFQDYFETEGNKIIVSAYNIKLLQAIDQLFSRGLAPEEVKAILEDGDGLFPTISQSSREMAREYFDSVEPLMDFEDEENERKNWARKAFKISLAALVVLILVSVASFQLGYLKPVGLYPGSRDLPEKVLNGPVEEDKEPEKEPEKEVDEIVQEPLVPALLPEDTTVAVLNGSGAPGIAGSFADKLREKGYQVVDVGNAASFTYTRSQVINRLETEEEAWMVIEMIPQAELVTEEHEEDKAMITVVLGADYEG